MTIQKFHAACVKGNLDVVREFVNTHPQSIDEASPEGWTGLVMACFNERIEVAKFLVDQGADVNATNAKGTTVFMYAKTPIQSQQSKTELLSYLIENGAHINALDKGGWSVLDYVIDNGALELAEWMKGQGALRRSEM